MSVEDFSSFERAGWAERASDIRVRTVAFEHAMASPEELWSGLLGGTVRTSALLRAQSAEVRSRVFTAFERLVTPYRRDGGLTMPVSCKLASGHLPDRARSGSTAWPIA